MADNEYPPSPLVIPGFNPNTELECSFTEARAVPTPLAVFYFSEAEALQVMSGEKCIVEVDEDAVDTSASGPGGPARLGRPAGLQQVHNEEVTVP